MQDKDIIGFDAFFEDYSTLVRKEFQRSEDDLLEHLHLFQQDFANVIISFEPETTTIRKDVLFSFEFGEDENCLKYLGWING